MSATSPLDEALRDAAARFGARPHVVEGERRFAFGDLDAAAATAGDACRRAGVRPGDRVLVRVTNTFEHLAAVFGVWRAGAVLVPVNPRHTEPEETTMAERAGGAFRASIDARTRTVSVERAGPGGAPEPDLAAIAFTSGTTGLPKGVEITHANVVASATAVARTRRDRSDSVAAVVSPLCHLPVFVSHYVARLLTGGTVVLGAFDAERLAASLHDDGVTDLPLVPAMVAPLLANRRFAAAPRLRRVTVGSATTPAAVKEALAERFPSAEIVEAYGLSESTDGLTMTVGREALERPGTVGRPHASIALAVFGPGDRPLPPDAPGEIVARGPTVMRGYHHDPEATAAALRGGWLHTGDLGRMDAEGYVYVTGRLKEIIITGGENVSPEEVEAVLARHPAVVEAAVFGIPDDRWGEQVAAAVVARAPVSGEALAAHVGTELARFKRPRRVFFVDEIPKTPAGKVKRRELRERFAKK